MLNYQKIIKNSNSKYSSRDTMFSKLLPFQVVSKRLCSINQRSKSENSYLSILISILWAFIGIVYFLISLHLFHSLWYHSFFSLFSTFVFLYLCYEYFFDWLEKKTKDELPRCCRKLAHYYAHYKGNIIQALKATEEKGPIKTRAYMMKIRKALESVKMNEAINKLKSELPYSWLKLLCVLLMLGKDSGASTSVQNAAENSSSDNEGRDELEKNIRRITNIFYLINIEQGRNDADLFGIELFMFISPYLIIIATELFNNQILIEMNALDIYKSIQAQTLKALIFLIGNISAVFIHWIRKQQN